MSPDLYTEILKSESMTALNSSQVEQLVEMYAEQVVDGMDMKTLCQFAFDTIVENMSNMDPEAILNEIATYYEDELPAMLEEVGADPDTIL